MTLKSPYAFCDEDLYSIRDELYEGSWNLFLQDLESLLRHHSYQSRINKRILRDIEVIKNIIQKEKNHE